MATTDFPETSPPPFDAAWFGCASSRLNEDGTALLMRAVQWVREPLAGHMASTGEPLDQHCAEVVRILAGMGTDAETRASALLTVLPPAASEDRKSVV